MNFDIPYYNKCNFKKEESMVYLNQNIKYKDTIRGGTSMKRKYFIKTMALLLLGLLFTGSIPAYASQTPAEESVTTQAEEENIDYILGRPMTEEEIAEQERITKEYSTTNNCIPLNPEEDEDQIYVESNSMFVRGSLPASYDSRSLSGNWGVVTPVKDQNPYGTCWAFSAISVIESNMCIRKHYSRDIDLSEAHLAYFSNFSSPEPLDNQYNDFMENTSPEGYYNMGGNSYMSYSTMAAGRGPTYEDDAPYSQLTSGFTRDAETAYPKLKYKYGAMLYGYYRIDKRNTDLIKQAIMEYGSVGVSFYIDEDNYLNYETAAYYCNEEKNVNHAVTIVGWNDNYSKNNFHASIRPSFDGAWIVKNSYGTEWGDEGYFYISYEDLSLDDFFTMEARLPSYITYHNCYQYDLTTAVSSGSVGVKKAANVFTVKANGHKLEELEAVSIAMTQSTNVNYSIQIYKNPVNSSDPESGVPLLCKPQTGSTTLAGYYTIPLNETVFLEPGDTFAVVFSFDKTTYVDQEVSHSENGRTITPSMKAGESHIYTNGWSDAKPDPMLEAFGVTAGNLRIKAFTTNLSYGSSSNFLNTVYRISGRDRYNTSFKIAEAVEEANGSVNNVIIASGKNFADALAGSYLAYQKYAPILLTNGKNAEDIRQYLQENLYPDGTVYILGGAGAVPESLVEYLSDFNVKRLSGSTRYQTNLEILKEAMTDGNWDIWEETGKEFIICTGKKFADSLSASSLGLPIMLVSNELSAEQLEYFASVSPSKFYVLGGSAAVSDTVVTQLESLGEVERISGKDRYETSVLIAEKFFTEPQSAVLAYAKNFPDGLCGGALASAIELMCPMILTAEGKETAAMEYMEENNINEGVVLGGDSLISDKLTMKLFQLKSAEHIIKW